ncbi:MAG TPA: M20/M25/M40 family metallo-hydrolase [Isosphaeraceae bacterium]|nr:M20/M25/M40 family metallo-hydrolase [Isosphaeraceae bacterium]
MTRFLRPNIARMAGYVPGEQPRDGGFTKLNTNENPYPPSPRVFEAVREALTGDRLRKYPDALGTAFRAAAARVTDDRGRGARVRFDVRRDYYPFRLKETAPVVRYARAAAERAGLRPTVRVTNGGLDANWMVRHGIPTVTFGAGQRNVHTIEEYVDVPDFLGGCRLALALATGAPADG